MRELATQGFLWITQLLSLWLHSVFQIPCRDILSLFRSVATKSGLAIARHRFLPQILGSSQYSTQDREVGGMGSPY